MVKQIGNCQICERDQKLKQGNMVHHGYRRPGWGHISGDCPGVKSPPYEVSCDLLKSYKASVEERLGNLEVYLAKLASGEITHLTELKARHGQHELAEYVAGVSDPWIWAGRVQAKTWSVEADIRRAKYEVERCEKRIDSWKLLAGLELIGCRATITPQS
jgi:hypothetical protein